MNDTARLRPGITLASGLVVVAIVFAAAILALRIAAGPAYGGQGDFLLFNAVAALAFAPAGLLVVRRDRRNAIGWMFIAGGLGNSLAGLGSIYAYFAFVRYPNHLAGGDVGIWLFHWAWIPLPMSILFTLALFPDGRPLSPRWRPLVWLLAITGTLWVLGAATSRFDTSGFPAWMASRANQLTIPLTSYLEGPVTVLTIACSLLAAVSLFLRFRRSRGDERQQLKWLTISAVPIVISFLAFGPFDLGRVLSMISTITIVVFLAPIILAITRYRLYDVDLVINRALVYGALSVLLLATYVVLVGALGRLIGRDQPVLLQAVTTVAVALCVLPFRQALQSVVNKLLYGKRREPMGLVDALGKQLEAAGSAGSLLQEVVEELSASLKLQGLAVLSPSGRVEAHAGTRGTSEASVDLVHQGELVGNLVATPRSGDALSSRDTRLLERLAPQLAIALRVSALNQALQGSRERLVNALEEERRRLRRDLHDGLGPVLTAAGLRADAARNLLGREPMAAEKQLVELREELTAAITEVRRLVYGLRPPALDELGLVGALRDQANSLVRDSSVKGAGMRVEVRAPARLQPMPAAVEVAAFRIALEALTNAARHAHAKNCVVALSVNGALQIDVRDDGAGLDATIKAGFGLTSMRERVAELGGTLDVTSVQGEGTHIVARLPLETTPA